MQFMSAIFAMEQGHKIKRHHWKGYWKIEEKNGKKAIMMYCKNGDVINLLDTDDVLYTLKNVASDDWEIVEDF